MLFSLFINDIGVTLEGVQFCIFADDLKIFKEIKDIEDTLVFQANIDSLQRYADDNQMTFNVKKCVIASFTKKTSSAITTT